MNDLEKQQTQHELNDIKMEQSFIFLYKTVNVNFTLVDNDGKTLFDLQSVVNGPNKYS